MIGKLGLLCALTAVLCAAGDRPPLAPEAAQFIQWYEGYKGSWNPPDVLKAYRDQLGKDGVAPAEVERRLGVINAAVRSMPVEFTTVHFNKIYTTPNPPFRQEPSQFLSRIVEGLKPGEA